MEERDAKIEERAKSRNASPDDQPMGIRGEISQTAGSGKQSNLYSLSQ
jgi:hypothetical protein